MKSRFRLSSTLVFPMLIMIGIVVGIAYLISPATGADAQEVKRIAPGRQGRNPHPVAAPKSEHDNIAPLRIIEFNGKAEAVAESADEASEPEQGTVGWQPTNGPYGGTITGLAVSGSSIFAGTSRGGMFVSTDQGASWQPTGAGVISRYVSSLLVSGGNIYAGADGERVYRSSDLGRTWALANNGLSIPNGYSSVSAMIAHGSALYAGSGFGWIFVSTDQGESWTPINAGFTPDNNGFFPSVTAFETIGDRIFVSTNGGGIYRFDNNARRWVSVNAGLPDRRIYSLTANGSKLIAGLSYNRGIYISTDLGQSWNPASSSPQDGISAFATMGNALYGAAYRAVYRSTDQGETWQELKTGFPASRLAGESIAVSGNVLFVGSFYDGIYRSDNGGENWALSSNGLAASDAVSLAASGGNVYAGTMAGGGVQVTSDNGQTWRALNHELPLQKHSFDTRRIGLHGSTLFLSTSDDGVFRSTDGGQNWQSVGNGLPRTQSDKAWPPMSYLSRGSNLYASLYNRGVYVSTDNGENWTSLNNGLTDQRCRTMTAIDSTLFAGAGDSSSGSLFRSTDGGQNWVELKNGLPGASVQAIEGSGTTLMAGTSRGVYVSNDNGETWIASTTGIGTSGVVAMAVKGQYIFAANGNGIFLSANRGGSWASIGTDLRDQFIRSLAVTDSHVFVGTQDRGVFARPLATIQCTYSISSTSRSVSGAAATGTVTVTATTGCPWQAISNIDWITVTSGASGTGNGTVGYSIAANSGQVPRAGTVTIAGQIFTVTQNGCATIAPASQNFLGNGGNGSVAVTGSGGCNWTATSAVDWLAIASGASGSGNGAVAFTVAINTSTNTRSGNLTIAGQTFIVTQAGSCPTTAIIPGQIISGSLSSTDCRTGLRNGQPFVDRYTFNGTAGQAVTILHYSEAFDSYLFLTGPDGRVVAEDDDGGPGNSAKIPANGFFQLPASGTYVIEATSYNSGATGSYLLYLGLGSANCSYTVGIPATPFTASGGTGNVSVTTGTDCLWQVASTVPWISFGSVPGGSGNGTASFTVAPNTDGIIRTGLVIAGGTALTVTQYGNPLACPALPISEGQTINGSLSSGDCPSAYRGSLTNRILSDHYSFTATAGQRIAVTMTSSAFDAYLYVIGPNGAVIGSDSDSGGGTNSRFPQTGFFQIPTTGSYLIETTANSSGVSGNYAVTLEVVAGTCAYSITPRTQIPGTSSGSGRVSVTATSGCQWRAISEASWLRVDSGATGNGNGIVGFSFTANTDTNSRSGRVRIAGEVITISQLGVNPLATVSAASFGTTAMAPESIAASFGSGLATTTLSAETVPLPTELAGTRVTVKDSANVDRLARLFFVSPGQVNFLIPVGTANGAAMVTVVSGDGKVSTGTVQVASVAPALFSANSTGQDVALGVVLRVRADGTQSYEPIARFDSTLNRFVAVPIDFGDAGDRIYLSLFGTGFRNLVNLSSLIAQIGGINTQVVYAGAQGNLAGVDQINLLLDRSLAGKGDVNVVMTANGFSANVVKVNFK